MLGSGRSRLATLLLCFFLGWLGVHRFYVGKVGTGVLMISHLLHDRERFHRIYDLRDGRLHA